MLGSGLDTTVVPWEACLAHFVAGSDIDRILKVVPDSDYKAFIRALIDHDRRNALQRPVPYDLHGAGQHGQCDCDESHADREAPPPT